VVADFTLRWLGLLTSVRAVRARLPANPDIMAPLDALMVRIEVELSDLHLADGFGLTFDEDSAELRLRQLVGEFHGLACSLGLCPHCNRQAIEGDA
jgi:hypothetical protein